MAAIAERRTRRRVPVIRHVSVELESPSITLQGKMLDLSTGGAFINMIVGLPVGSMVRLEFDLPTDESVRSPARICYVLPWLGTGLQFVGLDEESSTAIERFIESYLKI